MAAAVKVKQASARHQAHAITQVSARPRSAASGIGPSLQVRHREVAQQRIEALGRDAVVGQPPSSLRVRQRASVPSSRTAGRAGR